MCGATIRRETGSFVELENPLPTPESLHAMCDPEWMLEHLRDDPATQRGKVTRHRLELHSRCPIRIEALTRSTSANTCLAGSSVGTWCSGS